MTQETTGSEIATAGFSETNGVPDMDTVTRVAKKLLEVEKALNSIILGKPELVRQFLTGVVARGHILLEGLPGLGKTQMVRAFSLLASLKATRIQFTPDLMPLDITGSYILSGKDEKREYVFHPGPIFGNLVLADEINRASPKTQSALLEAMQERRVTILGRTHELEPPFFVLATQNPIELEGTYPLPEAQLDRFLFKLQVEDVGAEILAQIITKPKAGELPDLEPILSKEGLLEGMEAASRLMLSTQVAGYIGRLVRATHGSDSGEDKYIKYGASPRAALAIAAAARANALLNQRNTVGYEDVKAVAHAVLRHRILLEYSARLEGVTADAVVDRLLEQVPELERSAPETVMERLAQ